jgi:hypothetical protein
MRKIAMISLMVMMVLVIGAAGAVAAEPNRPGGEGRAPVYIPKAIYPGDYNPDVLMYRNPGSDAWQRVHNLDRLRHVACRDALEQLQREGKWQGHLNPDGTCGSTAEPSDWILGNRLNYDDSLE